MDRRRFIKNAIATSTAVYFSPALVIDTSLVTSAPITVALSNDIRVSICANFGSEFQVEDLYRSNDLTYANISNRDNHYLVTSEDQMHWKIVSTTSM
jgi:hypothetical protein